MASVTLRELDEADWPALQRCLSNTETVRYTEFEPLTEASARWLVQWTLEKEREEPRSVFAFGLAVAPDTPIIGIATLTIRDLSLGAADVGVIIGREHWGSGYGSAAVRDLLTLGFETLHLHRITGECDPANIGSARVLEKASMVREGCLHECRQQKGRWGDRLLYAILDRDWLTLPVD